ncbi:MAG: metallophosphatase family protein [Candidatus Sumerlaeaceae bacterium]|nr:metallophosphatase family protein [Candidatus Sumerlaeaceae bacterium]
MLIGVISDTHGYLNPKVYHHFAEVNYILHAGDVGKDSILDDLEEIAPVHAVSGNVDFPLIARRPLKFFSNIGGVSIGMTHGHLLDPGDYNLSAVEMFAAEKPRIIIHGHSHVAKNEVLGETTILNPGAACKPRFRDVSSIAIIEVAVDVSFHIRFIPLAPHTE